MSTAKDKKLDYVNLIAEESRSGMNLIKIYVQRKKHSNPPPNAYDLSKDWSKLFGERGKWLWGDRLTPAEVVSMKAKKAKIPGPGSYDTNNAKKAIKSDMA